MPGHNSYLAAPNHSAAASNQLWVAQALHQPRVDSSPVPTLAVLRRQEERDQAQFKTTAALWSICQSLANQGQLTFDRASKLLNLGRDFNHDQEPS